MNRSLFFLERKDGGCKDVVVWKKKKMFIVRKIWFLCRNKRFFCVKYFIEFKKICIVREFSDVLIWEENISLLYYLKLYK